MSAQQIYSVRFVGVQGLTGTTDFVCPAGYTLVVRDIDVYWGSQITVPSGRVLGAAGQAFAIWQGAALAANIMSWRGRQVFLPGETVTVSVDNGNADVTISGYQLTGVAP